MAAADHDGCALKLICLLEAAASQADDDEKTVLSFIGSVMPLAGPPVPHYMGGGLSRVCTCLHLVTIVAK